MDFVQVKELINIVGNSPFNDFELKLGDSYVKMNKNTNGNENVSSARIQSNSTQTNNFDDKNTSSKQESSPIIPEDISAPITIIPQDKVEIKEGSLVKAPIVGTFYQSASPDKPPFAKVGDKVKEGDILCVIEAMKIMNEIKSPYNGEVVEVLAENEDMVEYNQPLFRII